MRVTFKTLNKHMQDVINDRFSDLANVQEQLASGKRLRRPSDAPVDVANDLKLRSKVQQLGQYERNIEDGISFMQVTDTSMISMNTLIQRIRELAIQGSTDTLTAKERGYLNSEVEQLTRQLGSLLNTKYKGDYIFGGTQTRIAPFPLQSSDADTPQNYTNLDMATYDASAVAAGTPVQIRNAFDSSPMTQIIPGSFNLSVAGTKMIEGDDYTVDYVNGTITVLPTSPNAALLSADVSPGNPEYAFNQFKMEFEYIGQGQDIFGDYTSRDGDVLREIESGITSRINITGEQVTEDPETGTNILDVFIDLGQNLLHNDRNAIEANIGDIDISLKNLLAAQGSNGAKINRFETTLDRNESQHTETVRKQSDIEDVDFAKAASDFTLMQTVYNAALKSTARVIQPSLADFI